ncbi:MAG: endo-1,4-beta-xylanase [Niabella sp.]
MINKLYKKVAFFSFALALFSSCAKFETLDFAADKPENVLVQEDIDSYPALKSYINNAAHPDFKFGVALSLNDYVNGGVKYRLANRNFDEIVLGYEMKHGAVVQSNGSLFLDNVKKLLDAAREADMSVYGHTLTWHANQNAAYLNSLIAPIIIPAEPGEGPGLDPSVITNTDFESGINGWIGWGNGSTREQSANGEGYNNTGYSLKIVNPTVASSWSAQVAYDFAAGLEVGAKYVLTLKIKGSKAGSIGAGMQDPSNYAGRGDFPAIPVTTAWAEQVVSTSITGENAKRFLFNVGAYDGTIYLDDVTLQRENPDGGSVSGKMVLNNFESDNTGKTYAMSGNSTAVVELDPKGSGSKVLHIGTAATPSNQSHPKFEISLPNGLTLGDCQSFQIDFLATGTTGLYGSGMRMGINNEPLVVYGSPSALGATDNAWAIGKIILPVADLKLTNAQKLLSTFTLTIGSGTGAGNYYIDNLTLNWKLQDKVIEKTPEEKKTLITNALTAFIGGMVDTCKSVVKAWDVVNEPMDDGNPTQLKTGVGKTLAADEFYWQDYMGKDYAVIAFNLARQHGNPTDKLFINDYNLEHNLDKCRGLIAYVNYIESKGAKVDGIGTQMHININTSKDNITEHFRLLAATGKLIKISELDIGLGGVKTADATPAQYQAQADMYKYVIEKYFELIPAAQRYGITIWSPLDSPAGSSWRPDDPVGIWNINFVRKVSYKAVAEALAAKAGN